MAFLKLPNRIVRIIEDKVNQLFDKVGAKFLGTGSRDLFSTLSTPNTLQALYSDAANKFKVNPSGELLDSVTGTADKYLESLKLKSINKIVKDVESNLGKDTKIENVHEILKGSWDKVTSQLNTIVDSEVQAGKQFGLLDGIIKSNKQFGVDDPVVCFITMKDKGVCDDCRDLHTMPDGTPKVFKLSELNKGYFKKGDSSPSVFGLHPHCRCTMVTIYPGYGFDRKGKVVFKNADYRIHDEQSELSKAENLLKAEKEELGKVPDHYKVPEFQEFAKSSNKPRPYLSGTTDSEALENTYTHPDTQRYLSHIARSLHDSVNPYWGGPNMDISGTGGEMEGFKLLDPDSPHLGSYDYKNINLHPKQAQLLMHVLNMKKSHDHDIMPEDVSTLTHEILHASSHQGFKKHYKPSEPDFLHHVAIEEATTELLTHHYSHDVAHFMNGKEGSVEKRAPLWKLHLVNDTVEHLPDKPIPYLHYCKRFVDLVAYMDKFLDKSRSKIIRKINSTDYPHELVKAVNYHAHQLKIRHPDDRMDYLMKKVKEARGWSATHVNSDPGLYAAVQGYVAGAISHDNFHHMLDKVKKLSDLEFLNDHLKRNK